VEGCEPDDPDWSPEDAAREREADEERQRRARGGVNRGHIGILAPVLLPLATRRRGSRAASAVIALVCDQVTQATFSQQEVQAQGLRRPHHD
jgi:hypothetical protein